MARMTVLAGSAATLLLIGFSSCVAAAADGLPLTDDIRRIVIAEKPDGTSFVASDEVVAGMEMKGVGTLYTMWGNDTAAAFPDDGAQPKTEGLYPPVGGYRVYLTRYPAGTAVTPEQKDLTGGSAKLASGVPGMHKSDTTDFDIVLAGEVECILTDGTVVKMKAGDMMVLNGADHAWRNSGTEDAVIAFFMAGANRK